MPTRFETTTKREPTNEGQHIDKLLWLRRSGAVVMIGALALPLAGCKKGSFGSDDYEPGTIEETRVVLADTAFVECLDDTPYSIHGSGADISDELYGKYQKGYTRPVVTITPEEGGKTLLLEQVINTLSRPERLMATSITDMGILEDIDCSPADIPLPEDKVYQKYNVKANTKALKDHHLID